MKNSIMGFNQEQAVLFRKTVVGKDGKEKEIRVDCVDLLIMRWFIDFFPTMRKVEVDGVQYAWVQYKNVQEDLPILDIQKRALFDRFKKLCDFGILEHVCLKEEGTCSYYRMGSNYRLLIESMGGYAVNCRPMQSTADPCSQLPTPMQSTADQIHNICINKHDIKREDDVISKAEVIRKDISIKREDDIISKAEVIRKDIGDINKEQERKDNHSTYIYSRVSEILAFLNEKAHTAYRATTRKTQALIEARLKEGFTVEDFKKVISNKCTEWMGTEWEKFLRPETLFGTKFENYLNAPPRRSGQKASPYHFMEREREDDLPF